MTPSDKNDRQFMTIDVEIVRDNTVKTRLAADWMNDNVNGWQL